MAVGQPGQVSQIVVTRWGGETKIDGVPIVAEDKDLPAFRTGDELFLMLQYNQSDRKFHLIDDGISGVFAVVRGQIQPLLPHPMFERFRGMTLAQMESEVRRVVP